MPPATSAIKVDGKRAYALARAGVAVEMPSREVQVYALDVVGYEPGEWPRRARHPLLEGHLRACAGSRIGEALGCGAYCAELRRLAIGHLPIERAGTLDAVAADPLGGGWRMSCSEALAHLPARELQSPERDALLHGRAIEAHGEEAPVRCLWEGRLVCVAGPRGRSYARSSWWTRQ